MASDCPKCGAEQEGTTATHPVFACGSTGGVAESGEHVVCESMFCLRRQRDAAQQERVGADERARGLDEQLANAETEIEAWKLASGLEDVHGDPDGVTPSDLEAEFAARSSQLAAAQAIIAKAQGLLRPIYWWSSYEEITTHKEIMDYGK